MKAGERQKAELKEEGRKGEKKRRKGKKGGERAREKQKEKNRTTFSKLVFGISIDYCVLAP